LTNAGEGALRFAIEMGFTPQQLLTPQSLEAWLRWKNAPNRETFWLDERKHDTIGMFCVDGRGNVVAGCSTTGLVWKIPGRVADSPLVGQPRATATSWQTTARRSSSCAAWRREPIRRKRATNSRA
jgi:isoaspartyl peptidase/L-asparaginase-like protein (Ntn-hydrolase superfamily)